MPKGMLFKEVMSGTWQPVSPGTATGRACPSGGPIRFDVVAETPELLRLFGTVSGALSGTLSAAGLADHVSATGTIEVSPIEHRRIRYTVDFPGDDGASYRFDGWKSIDWTHVLSTWTTLPGTITGPDDRIVGTATLRFAWRDAPSLLASVRVRGTRPPKDPVELAGRRWNGGCRPPRGLVRHLYRRGHRNRLLAPPRARSTVPPGIAGVRPWVGGGLPA